MRDEINNKFSGVYGELMLLRTNMWSAKSKCSKTQKDDIRRLTIELDELRMMTMAFIDDQTHPRS